MEIFKLFNPEWPVGSPKTSSSNKCNNCEALTKQLQDKHEILLSLIKKGTDVQNQLQESEEKEMEMQTDLDRLKINNQQFLTVLDDYDQLLTTLLQDRNAQKSSSDVALKHLTNLEFSFSDVHSKYERSKQVLEGYKENETLLLESIKENERTIMDLQNRCENLKEDSTIKLEEANETLHNMVQQHKEELQKYKTRVKMLEITVNSLENALQQKVSENHKLSSICDDFINT